MPRAQTVFSELTVARGINNGDLKSIINIDKDVLSTYAEEAEAREELNIEDNALYKAGVTIKNWLQNEKKLKNIEVKWIGAESIRTASAVAKDIIINNEIRISVKENAQLFQNPSPVNVFEKWPSGILFTHAQDDDWFIKVANYELNEYFKSCNGSAFTKHKTIQEYYKNIYGSETLDGKSVKRRKSFTEHVKKLHKNLDTNVLSSYKDLCKKVSQESALIFNNNIKKTFSNFNDLDICDKHLISLFSVFFKLDDTEYILAGTENSEPFAVIVDNLNMWSKKFQVKEIKAEALDSGQPEVLIKFTFLNIEKKENIEFSVKSEIRWSHGKFCGNPESKLYKRWEYVDLPWVKSI